MEDGEEGGGSGCHLQGIGRDPRGGATPVFREVGSLQVMFVLPIPRVGLLVVW